MTQAERLAQAWMDAVRDLDAGRITVERYTTRCETILAVAESTGDAQGLHAGAMWDIIRSELADA